MKFMQHRFYHKKKIGLNIQFSDTNILQKAVDLSTALFYNFSPGLTGRKNDTILI
jgi:hypothetical protein